MNIVFWSPLSGHGATTSNLSCMAIMSSLLYRYKTVAFQSGFSNNYLDQTFLGKSLTNHNLIREELVGYGDKGIDSVMSSIALNTYVNEDITDYMVEVVKDVNYYIPSTRRSTEEVYNKRMQTCLPQLLKICDRLFDITFIDAQSNQGDISRSVLEEADLCVINLNQNPELIHYAQQSFEEFSCSAEVMYLVGRYDASNRYTLRSISNKFHIPKSDIGAIPYNSEFMEASLSGRTKEFLKENLHCSCKNFNYNFMNEVTEVTDKLLIKAGLIHG